MVPRIDIRLHRLEQLRRSGRELSKQRLAPDDDDLCDVSDSGCCANHVLELLAGHEAMRSRSCRQIRSRVG